MTTRHDHSPARRQRPSLPLLLVVALFVLVSLSVAERHAMPATVVADTTAFFNHRPCAPDPAAAVADASAGGIDNSEVEPCSTP